VMRAACQHDDVGVCENTCHQFTRMTADTALRESGYVGVSNADCIFHLLGKPSEAGAEHERQPWREAAQALFQNVGRRAHVFDSEPKARGKTEENGTVSRIPFISQR